MIPRYQRILFVVLLVSSLAMAVALVFLHQRNFSEVKNADNTPIEAPVSSRAERVTLMLADDTTGNLKAEERLIALPGTPAVRARALLEHLLAEYALPRAAHHTGGGASVDDLYLVPLPLGGQPMQSSIAPATQPSPSDSGDPLLHAAGELAVINLRPGWVEAHPPGITAETLTLQSMLATLHANLPEITAVRFLVDGRPRPTLAGNVELDRTYDVNDARTP